MKGILALIGLVVIGSLVGTAIFAPGVFKGDTSGVPTLEIVDSSDKTIEGIQTTTGDLTIGFDHIDEGAGVTLTDDTDVDVDVFSTSETSATGYKLKKHSTTGSAIIGINPTVTTLYIVPSVPDNDFYFSPDAAVSDNPRITSWFYDDITGDGAADFVLVTNALNLEELGTDDNGNPKFTVDLTWLDYTVASSFAALSGQDDNQAIGTGTQTTNIGLVLTMTAGDAFGLTYVEQDFNSTLAVGEWDESLTCLVIPGHPTTGNKLCLDSAGMDRDKFSANTVYTYEYGSKKLNDLNYITVPIGGDTTVDIEYKHVSEFTSTNDGTTNTITLGYREADKTIGTLNDVITFVA